MQNLKIEMKPLIKNDGKEKPSVSFRLKIEAEGGAVECEEMIKYLQGKSVILTKGDKIE